MQTTTTVGWNDLSSKYVPLGIAVAVFSVIAIALLQYTKRVRKMLAYFKTNFSALKKNHILAVLATVLYYILLAVPIVLLIIWIIFLGSASGTNPSLPILFSFLFIVSLVMPVPASFFYVKVLVCFIFFITSQLVTMGLFWDNRSSSAFFTLTSILLSINGSFVSIGLWLFDGTSWALPQYTSNSMIQRIREKIQIWKQKQNPPKIIDGGLYYYISIRPTLKLILIIVVYLLSILTLMTYSLVGYYHTSYGTIALFNSICIITTDIILAMVIFITRQAKFNPITNAVAAMALRGCIVGFTGDLWFLGYCFLYLILGIYLFLLIINKYYPNYEKLPSLAIQKRNILTMPQLPTLVLQLMFAGSIFYVASDKGKFLKIVKFNMDGTIFQFWVIGIAFIILLFATFFYLISLRIVERSKSRIRSINFYFMGCEGCSQYYFFVFFAYSLLVILGFYMYDSTGSSFIWNSCVFLPLFYQALVLFYSNWQDNDFLLLGSVEVYNKKIQKRKQRIQKLNKLKTSGTRKLKIQEVSKVLDQNNMMKSQPLEDEQKGNVAGQTSKFNILQGAQVQSNFMVQDYKGKTYQQWRNTYGLVAAFRQNKLLPSDKKIIITVLIMLASLIGYCIVYTINQRKVTAVIISVQIIFLFLTLIPMKRYFSTLQTPNLGQIISFTAGIVLNYAFGILSYVLQWNNTDLWTIWWAVINLFLLSVYAALALLRDKGLNLVTYIVSAVSVLLLIIAGILIIVLFNSIAIGIAMIGIAVYYGYIIGLYLIYLSRNKSLPQFLHYITLLVVVCSCFAVMIYGFIADDFDDFFGFSITYLVINLLIIVYGAYALLMDYTNRYDRPNFYSPYGTPVFKYDQTTNSVKTNIVPLAFWLGGLLMFYGYTLLMQIFITNTNTGISASSLFFVTFFLSFLYFTTYNVYRAGKMKSAITQKIIQQSWDQIVQIKKANGQTDININTLTKQLQNYVKQGQTGSAVKLIMPVQKQGEKEIKVSGQNGVALKTQESDITLIINDLQQKIQKQIQNQEISLVNLCTRIMLKCEAVKKTKMLAFTNFLKEEGDALAELGIAIVLDQQLYDLQSIYNQAFQQYNMISAFQKIQFDKKFKAYAERKIKNEHQNEQLNKKQHQAHNKREQDLKNKLQIGQVDDSNKPIQQMRDSPLKMKKLSQNLKQPYVDAAFQSSAKFIPLMARNQCKQWVRPPLDSVLLNENTSMNVRQGYIGNCYLISAIGVLDAKTIKKILGVGQWKNAEGSFMVKFRKYGKDVYIIVDSKFPSLGGDQWLFGRCENKKEIFTNILEKAYAKLYGGYQNIIGGKISLALADMTGGFPQQIKLKKYQQQNVAQLFNMMVSFKKCGYLMGAGSPQNAQGDTVDVDGIVQGHAYLVIDVRDLDGNKLLKIRNPHGTGGRQSTLDWSDNSPKWTKRLLNLLGQKMEDDGAFWMSIEDFVFSFRALYVCRIFDQSIWKRVGPVSGIWKGQSAAGLPTKKYPTAQLSKNPHYGIKVTKKSTLFVQLNQNQQDQQRKGKNYIFFLVQKNDGKRISSNSANKLCGTSGSPINSVSVSGQVELFAQSYPYVFSLLVSSYQKGCQGSFSLSLYCDDLNMEVIENQGFDL